MKQLLLIFVLILLPNTFESYHKLTAEQLAEKFTALFMEKRIEEFAKYHPKGKVIRFLIEGGYYPEDNDPPFRAIRTRDFNKAAKWLKESYGTHNATLGEYAYQKGVVSYDWFSMLHGYLYLKTIICSYHKGKPYIDTVIFESGD